MTDSAMPITPPYTPELLKDVQSIILLLLATKKSPEVLELGSGWSTVWFAEHGAKVYSVEHDKGWRDEVARVLLAEDLYPRAWLKLLPADSFVDFVDVYYDSSFDLILVDCIDEQRLPCIEAARTKVRPGGVIVVDDSHWPILVSVPALLAGWTNYTVKGMHTRKTGEQCYHQTTFYVRPVE